MNDTSHNQLVAEIRARTAMAKAKRFRNMCYYYAAVVCVSFAAWMWWVR
jgi:hypothetical protein